MDLILETKRLILREMRHEDATELYEMDSNPNVHKYLWNKPNTSINEIHDYISLVRQQYLDYKIGRFVAILKETNEIIGWIGLKYNTIEVNNKINFYDIGYRLNEKFWGQGYAFEAANAWVNFGFDTMKIPIIHAATNNKNNASIKILLKIGMTETEKYLEDLILWNWYEISNPNKLLK